MVPRLLGGEAHLECMRTGHVAHRPALVGFARDSLTETRRQRCVVAETGVAVQDRDPLRVVFPMIRPVEDERRIGDFEVQFAARQVRPLALQQIVGIRVLRRVGRFR